MKVPAPPRYSDYCYYVDTYNPFLFREPGSNIPLCLKKRDFYYFEVLRRMLLFFKRGYVDLKLFVSIQTGYPLHELGIWEEKTKSLFSHETNPFWNYLDNEEGKRQAKLYFMAMHLLTGTVLNHTCFDSAWKTFHDVYGYVKDFDNY